MSEHDDPEPPRFRVAPLRFRIGETGAVSSPGTGAPQRFPIVTCILLGVIIATTAVEFYLANSTDPPPAMLMALGGMNASAVRGGDWYRLVTAALLHGGILHLLLNGLALFLGGAIVELLANRSWLVVIAVVSAVSGSALGYFINDSSIVSVGASGSIMGILASGVVLSFRLPAGPARNQLLGTLARFLIPSLLPLATSGSGGRIDYSAHIGGALGGAAVGGLLLLAGIVDKKSFARIGATIAVCFVAASVGVEAKQFAEQGPDALLDATALLVPDGTIPKDWDEATSTVDTWGKDRPRDPRVHMFRALKVMSASDPVSEEARAKAKAELRAALEEKAVLRKSPDRKLELGIRGILCTILKDEGHVDEAEKEAQPVCDAGVGGAVPPVMNELGLCAKTTALH